MPDPRDLHPARPSAAARDARALLDASDAEALGDAGRTTRLSALMESVWAEIQAQQDEIAELRARLADATEAAEHAVAGQRTAESAAADREADLRTELRDKAEEFAILTSRATRQQAEIQSLRDDLEAARDDATRARQRAAHPATTADEARPSPRPSAPRPAPRPVAEAPPAEATRPAPPPAPPAEPPTIESVYRTFCRAAGGLNSRVEIFASTLSAAFPTSDVRTVYRDADSPARPVVLTTERQGNSAVPFWAVSVEGRHLLVPQPMGADQFRELAPCFTGQAAPASLAEIEPAALATLGGGFVLDAPGHVS